MYYTVHDLDGSKVEEGILIEDIFDIDSIRSTLAEKLPMKSLTGTYLASLYYEGTEEHPFAIITVQTT